MKRKTFQIAKKRRASTTVSCPTCRKNRDRSDADPAVRFHRRMRKRKLAYRMSVCIPRFPVRWKCSTCKRLRNGPRRFPTRSRDKVDFARSGILKRLEHEEACAGSHEKLILANVIRLLEDVWDEY